MQGLKGPFKKYYTPKRCLINALIMFAAVAFCDFRLYRAGLFSRIFLPAQSSKGLRDRVFQQKNNIFLFSV